MGPEYKKDRGNEGDDWRISLPKVPGGDGARAMPSEHREISEADLAAEEEWRRRFRDAFGISRHVYKDESLAPPVDMELVRAYVKHQLPEEEMQRVLRLMIDFKSWNEAELQVLHDASQEALNRERERRSEERREAELN